MTARQKVGWKVLSDSRERRSCVMNSTLSGRSYLKGKKVIPVEGCGPLCVFTCKHSAYSFITRVGCHYKARQKRIVKCLYKPSKVESIWSNIHPSVPLRDLPTKTALADSGTCLE